MMYNDIKIPLISFMLEEIIGEMRTQSLEYDILMSIMTLYKVYESDDESDLIMFESLIKDNDFMAALFKLKVQDRKTEFVRLDIVELIQLSSIFYNAIYFNLETNFFNFDEIQFKFQLTEYLKSLAITGQNNESKILHKLLPILAKRYNVEQVEDSFLKTRFYNFQNKEKSQHRVFLSHAYDDRFLAFILFTYFKSRGIFLYVDWMENGKYDNGSLLKNKLSINIQSCNQLLFLDSHDWEMEVEVSNPAIYPYTMVFKPSISLSKNKNPRNSQKVRKEHQVRQFCAWEMGVFFRKDKEKNKFIFNYRRYNNHLDNSLFLQSLETAVYIRNGKIA